MFKRSHSMTRRTSRYLLAVLAIAMAGSLVLEPAVLAQRRGSGATVDESAGPFGALRWRSIGPQRGGRSIAVAGSAGRPLEYYFGATGGGLWKTTDGGVTWQPVTDNQIASSSVGAVAVAPSNPDVVYIGTGETEIRGNIAPGDGVYKTTDAGKTWTHVGLRDAQNIAKIRVHPTNPDVVFVAAFGHHAAPNAERGIFRTKDGGKTWEKVLARDPKTGGIEVVLDPNNPSVLYASLWEAFRNTYMMSSGGPGSGLFKSTDGGDHWTEISRNPGLPKGILGKIDRSRRRRHVHVGRRRRDVEEGEREPRRPAARLLLHARVRRSEGQGRLLRAERRLHEDDGRRQNVDAAAPAPRRQPRHVDRPDEPEAVHRVERRRRDGDDQRRPDLDRSRRPDGAVLSRDHDERRPVSRVRRAAGQLDGVRRQSGGGGLSRTLDRRRRQRRERRPDLLHRRRRRERLHRAGSEEP
ncbi:MAG: hypothetical protein DMF86_20305 [Acidobacteria bacterium]|nr:MAG: hypothetical protein DMF86_20305 [Acidobacteriota bacterium]